MLKRIKNYIHKANESGRSMVEMLGVLAIVGVLTIGGLAGYNFAMNKYRANEIVHGLNLRLTVARQQITLGAPINMSEFEDAILGSYGVTVTRVEDTPYVEVEIVNIPAAVAERLLTPGGELWTLPVVSFDIIAQSSLITQVQPASVNLVKPAYAASDFYTVVLELNTADHKSCGSPSASMVQLN